MKDKLEIGMYVRTKEGFIGKFVLKGQGYTYTLNDKPKFVYYFDTQMWDSRCTDRYVDDRELSEYEIEQLTIKPSYDIMDLIEPGDYVNGRKVYQVGYNFQDDFVLKMSDSNYDDFIYSKDIETIVTKEQFEMMTYKIGDGNE